MGPAWSFTYETLSTASVPWVLKQLTTPSDGTIVYQFGNGVFHVGSDVINSPALLTRTVNAVRPAGSTGVWTYAYTHNTTTLDNETTVTAPADPGSPSCGGMKTVYHFLGIGYTQQDTWKLGSLHWRETRDSSNRVWEREDLTWIQSPPLADFPQGNQAKTYAPLLSVRDVTRPGGTSVHFKAQNFYNPLPSSCATAGWCANSASNFADYGRPYMTTESGDVTRTVSRTFFYPSATTYSGFGTYIVDKPEREVTCSGAVACSPTGPFKNEYEYETAGGYKGFVKKTIRHGIVTHYTPLTSGNVGTAKDGNGKITTFTYDWGTLKNTDTPENFSITRVINSTGTVASETRRTFTTSFGYDSLFRLISTTPHLGTATIITYDPAGTYVKETRGSVYRQSNIDGFGRETDSVNAEAVRTRQTFDKCGRVNYTSFPHVSTDIGVIYELDTLGRTTKETRPNDAALPGVPARA